MNDIYVGTSRIQPTSDLKLTAWIRRGHPARAGAHDVRGFAAKQPFGLLCRAAIPFIVLMLISLVIVIWQPWIAMYLVTGKF